MQHFKKKENMKLCILDIGRWNSTSLMVLRLIELKPFCTDHQLINTDLFLSTRDWNRIDNLVIKATIMNSYY